MYVAGAMIMTVAMAVGDGALGLSQRQATSDRPGAAGSRDLRHAGMP
jgi:hypothetical protein